MDSWQPVVTGHDFNVKTEPAELDAAAPNAALLERPSKPAWTPVVIGITDK